MTILVDMDDVLELLVSGWTAYLNEKHGINVDPNDVNDWDITLAFPMLTSEQIYAAEQDDHLWDYVEPMPGAPETLKRLIDEGHTLYVVTSSYYQTMKSKMDNVLFRYFPFLKWEQVIVTFNKQMIKGDVLIDDGPHNLIGGSYRKILFDRPHNRNFNESLYGIVRAKDWDDVYIHLQKILDY